MVKINFQNNITKANADTFNTMQDNIEDAITETSTDLTNYIDEKLEYSTNSYTSNGATIRFEKYGRMVVATFDGYTTSTITANTDYEVNIDEKYLPLNTVRNNLVIIEGGTTVYAWIDANTTKLKYRTRTTLNSPTYPRCSFTYIAKN